MTVSHVITFFTKSALFFKEKMRLNGILRRHLPFSSIALLSLVYCRAFLRNLLSFREKNSFLFTLRGGVTIALWPQKQPRKLIQAASEAVQRIVELRSNFDFHIPIVRLHILVHILHVFLPCKLQIQVASEASKRLVGS